MPHCQTFGGLRIDCGLALYTGSSCVRERRDEPVRALVALGERAYDQRLYSPKSVEPMENRPLRVQWEEQIIHASSAPEPLR